MAADRAAAELPPRFANAIVAAPDAGRMSTSDGHAAGVAPAAGGDRRRGGRRVRGAEPRRAQHRPPEGARGRLVEASATSPMCWSPWRPSSRRGRSWGWCSRARRSSSSAAPSRDRARRRSCSRSGSSGRRRSCGDTASFLLGRRLGRGFVLRHGSRVRITPERFARVEDYFSRHGGKTIVVGRFIGLVRALAPFVAGSSGMRYSYYLPFSVLGTGLWAAAFALIGYFASQSLDAAAEGGGPGHAAVRDRGGRDRGDRAGRSVPARAREPAAAGGGDGAPSRASSGARPCAQAGAAGALRDRRG